MTLAAHANAALRGATALRLPAHPAYLVVRRAQVVDRGGTGDVAAWFEQVRSAGQAVLVSDAGIDGAAVLVAGGSGWSVDDRDGGVVLTPIDRREVSPLAIAQATDLLRTAAAGASEGTAGNAPQLWTTTVERAMAILDSVGAGEELSDVAWPHFLLPPEYALGARRLAAAAATLWLWDGPGSWTGDIAERAHARLRPTVAGALVAAVDGETDGSA